MNKVYVDYAKLQKRQEEACQAARERLKAKGIFFPVNSSSIPQDEYYDHLRAYSEAEAAIIVEIMQSHEGGERPLVVDSVKPRAMGWEGYSD